MNQWVAGDSTGKRTKLEKKDKKKEGKEKVGEDDKWGVK